MTFLADFCDHIGVWFVSGTKMTFCLLEGFQEGFSIMNGSHFTAIPDWKTGKDVQPSLCINIYWWVSTNNKHSLLNARLTSFVCWEVFSFLSVVFVTYPNNLPKPLGLNFSEYASAASNLLFNLMFDVVDGEVPPFSCIFMVICPVFFFGKIAGGAKPFLWDV